MKSKDNSDSSSIGLILITGLISLVVGVGSGLLINYFTTERPQLTYDITTLETFSGKETKLGLFAIRISNEGKREVEDLSCEFRFTNGSILETKVSEQFSATTTTSAVESGVRISLPYLNPSEQMSLQVLLSEVHNSLAKPSIEIRGKGIVGKVADEKESITLSILKNATTIFAAISTFVFILVSRIFGRGSITGKHSDDQRDVLCYVLSNQKLLDEAAYIWSIPRKVSYWSASDQLVSKWINNGNAEKMKQGLDALKELLSYASIAQESVSIVKLNASKLAVQLGFTDEALRLLKESKNNASSIVCTRIKTDIVLRELEKNS